MTGFVADEILGRFARQQHDWFERVRKGSLDPGKVAVAVQEVIDRGEAYFKYDMRKEGWKLLENGYFDPIDPAKLEIVSFLKEGERSISGEELVRRASQELYINFGQRHAEYLFEHQKEIPVGLQYHINDLVFAGTIWRDLDGKRRMVSLTRSDEDGSLYIGFPLFDDQYYSYRTLVRHRK